MKEKGKKKILNREDLFQHPIPNSNI